MSISGGVDWVTIQRYISRWVLAGSGLPSDRILWSQNKAPRPAADGITMHITSVVPVGDPWVDVEDNPFTFDDLTVTSVSAAANTLSITAHDLQTGDGPLHLVGAALPGGLGEDTNYWAIRVDADTIKLASTFVGTGGTDVDGSPSGNPVTPIDITTAGVGGMTLVATDDTVRAGEEVRHVARSEIRLFVSVECHSIASTGLDMALAILHRISARSTLPSQVELLAEANMGVVEIERVKSVRLGAHLDGLLFEPRAILDVQFSAVSEDFEGGTIIATFDETGTLDEQVQATHHVLLDVVQ